MHRYVLNLASGAGEIPDNAPESGEGEIPRAPRVPPGTYTVELQVNGGTPSQQPLVVVADPRSPATQADLLRQYEVSSRVFQDVVESRRALAEIASVKAHFDRTVEKAPPGKADELAEIAARRADLDGITNGAGGLAAAAAALSSALHAVESSDREAPSQAIAVYEAARGTSQAKLQQWAALKAGPLADLSGDFERDGMAALPIREIEREIEHYLTR